MPNQKEKIIDCIAGILRVNSGGGYEFLGTGKMFNPENAMIITDKRILLINVPLSGAGKIVAGTHIPMWQWVLTKKDIKNKLKEMLSSLTLQKILESNPKNFLINLSEITKVKMGKISRSIKFITKTDKKYKYSIRNKEDFKKAKVIFNNFI